MKSSSEHQGDGRTPWEGQEAAVAAEEDDPREQERQQHPRAEITQIKALLRRNLLVRLKRVCSVSPLRPSLGHASVAAGCQFEHRSFQNNCPPLASHFCPPQGRASNLQGSFCACLVFLCASVESTAFMNERPPRRCHLLHVATGASKNKDDDVLRAFQPCASSVRAGVRLLSVGHPRVPREGGSFCAFFRPSSVLRASVELFAQLATREAPLSLVCTALNDTLGPAAAPAQTSLQQPKSRRYIIAWKIPPPLQPSRRAPIGRPSYVDNPTVDR